MHDNQTRWYTYVKDLPINCIPQSSKGIPKHALSTTPSWLIVASTLFVITTPTNLYTLTRTSREEYRNPYRSPHCRAEITYVGMWTGSKASPSCLIACSLETRSLLLSHFSSNRRSCMHIARSVYLHPYDSVPECLAYPCSSIKFTLPNLANIQEQHLVLLKF